MKLFCPLVIILLVSCNEKQIDTKEEGEKLMQLSREWAKIASTGDIEKTLSYWDDDATILSPGQPIIKGKKAIRDMLETTSQIPGFSISWEPVSVVVSEKGDMAYMIEKNQVTMKDSSGRTLTEYNKAVTIWKKNAEGNWKNVVDTWNADPSQK
ncbi:MAG: YybH family protein [Flavisolibacter sp.]